MPGHLCHSATCVRKHVHQFELDRRRFQEKGSTPEDPIVIDDEKITVHGNESSDESTVWIADSSYEDDIDHWSDEEEWVDPSDDVEYIDE